MSTDPLSQPTANLDTAGLAEIVAALDALDAQLHQTRLILGARLKAAEIAADPVRMARLADAVEDVNKNPPKPEPPDALERRLAELRRQR